MTRAFRYYVRSPDGRAMFGFDVEKAAELTATEYGDGALIIDTLAKSYQPMLSQIVDGEVLIAGISGWDTGKPGQLDKDFIEAAKKHVALIHAFLEKGANVNARDGNGGSALHWAVGAGHIDSVRLLLERGADPEAVDAFGQTPLMLAEKRGRRQIAILLRQT